MPVTAVAGEDSSTFTVYLLSLLFRYEESLKCLTGHGMARVVLSWINQLSRLETSGRLL